MPYFDHNATTPLAPAARAAWLRAQDEAWHNPSSLHRPGARARLKLDAVRESLAVLLECDAKRLVFTSGATEGAGAVLAHWAATLPADATVAINPTEHPCALAAAGKCFAGRLHWLSVDRDGLISLDALRAALASGVRGVVVMAANNETGVLQPWTRIAELCRSAGVPFLCDASQWLGKLPAGGFGSAGWVIGAGHKFGGPKGTGFVQLPGEEPGFQARLGGAQEHGHRAGTEDLAGAAAMVSALAEAERNFMILESERVRWRESFERAILAAVPGTRVVAAEAERLWNTVALIMPFGENTRWVARLDKHDVQVSTGSACAAGKDGPSHVLAALGVPPEKARRVIRVSSGWSTSEAEWQALPAVFHAVAAELRDDEPGVITSTP